MNKEAIDWFKAYFTEMDLSDLSPLDEVYSNDIVFRDPVHEVSGIENLKRYFGSLNKNLSYGSFTFENEAIVNNTVYIGWQMHLKLKKPEKEINVSGVSAQWIKK